MKTRSTEVKVGIAVILAAIILILGIAWIGEFRLSRKWVAYTVYFNDVGGLNPGDPVTVSGVESGKVGSVVLEQDRVRTEILVEEGVVINEDSSVEIRSIGLMGEKFIYILPGKSGARLPPGSAIQGRYKAGITEVTENVGDLLVDMREMAQSLKKIVLTDGSEYNLVQSLGKLNEVADELLVLLRENREDMRTTAQSLKSMSQDLRDVVGEKKDELASGIDRLSSAAGRLDSLSSSIKSIVDSVEHGDGTLGMLIKQKTVHQEIEATLVNLNGLLNDMKEHPERYFKVEIF